MLIDQRRHLVALVEHVIDTLARYRASEGDVAIHAPSSQQTGASGCAVSIATEKKEVCLRQIKAPRLMRRTVVNGSRAGVPRQQCQSGSLPPVPGKVGRSTRKCTRNGAGNGAVSCIGRADTV
jgi:hypothetical protein